MKEKVKISKKLLELYDSSDMYNTVLNMPEQIAEAYNNFKNLEIKTDNDNISNITLFGMGGSAIAGDIIKSYLYGLLNVPFNVNKNYFLPGYVNENSLLIFVSYSGNTEETLSSFEQAKNKTKNIVCISSGGKLTELAEENNFPVITLPGGYQPRATIGFGITVLLFLLNKLSFIADPSADFEESISLLKTAAVNFEIENQSKNNIPLNLAEETSGCIPMIYCTEPYFSIIGWRWKGQIAENSKAMAFTNSYPELNHNEIVGWQGDLDLSAFLYLINLKDEKEHNRTNARMEFTTSLIMKKTCGFKEILIQGESLLARYFYAVFLGDIYSVYLALANKVDPTPVESINKLKDYMNTID